LIHKDTLGGQPSNRSRQVFYSFHELLISNATMFATNVRRMSSLHYSCEKRLTPRSNRRRNFIVGEKSSFAHTLLSNVVSKICIFCPNTTNGDACKPFTPKIVLYLNPSTTSPNPCAALTRQHVLA
jgi:hypothetical protein